MSGVLEARWKGADGAPREAHAGRGAVRPRTGYNCAMDAPLAARIAACTGRGVRAARRVEGGYTPAARWVVTLDDGATVFAKVATAANVARWLRDEHLAYQTIRADCMPAFVGWDDDGAAPILLLEDLSGAHWPPPWTPRQVEAVRAALGRLADTPPPAHLRDVAEDREALTGGWRRVAAEPEPFLGLGLCSAAWLARALPRLCDAEAAAPIDGDDCLHLDVRSDNICLVGERAVLVDWNWACRGNRALDLAGWAPSLHFEGGPAPEALLPDAAPLAAAISGYFASQAGLPTIPTAPRVRSIQRAQLTTALPWAARALGLPGLGGGNAGR